MEMAESGTKGAKYQAVPDTSHTRTHNAATATASHVVFVWIGGPIQWHDSQK